MAKLPQRVTTPLKRVTNGMLSVWESATKDAHESELPEVISVTTPTGSIIDVRNIDIERILDNPHQARRTFDLESLSSLAASIESMGLQQPIIVSKAPEAGCFLLVAGERRLRAHRLLKKSSIMAIVIKESDNEAISLIENIQRMDLNVVELATGLSCLIANGEHTQREASRITGLSENVVGRTLAVMSIFELVPELLTEYQADPAVISDSNMMELSAISSPETLRTLWEKAKLGKLSRNDIRLAAKREKLEKERSEKPKKEPSPAVLERRLTKKVQRSLKTLETEVDTLDVIRDKLTEDHRDGLRTLRTKIDLMLSPAETNHSVNMLT